MATSLSELVGSVFRPFERSSRKKSPAPQRKPVIVPVETWHEPKQKHQQTTNSFEKQIRKGTVQLDSSNIRAEQLYQLQDVLQETNERGEKLCKMKHLDLSFNNLTDNLASIIIGSLRINESLRSLDISTNLITHISLKNIANMLRKNNSLEQLDVSCNKFSCTQEGFQALVDVLGSNQNNTLKKLNLTQRQSEGYFLFETRAQQEDFCFRLLSRNNTLNVIGVDLYYYCPPPAILPPENGSTQAHSPAYSPAYSPALPSSLTRSPTYTESACSNETYNFPASSSLSTGAPFPHATFPESTSDNVPQYSARHETSTITNTYQQSPSSIRRSPTYTESARTNESPNFVSSSPISTVATTSAQIAQSSFPEFDSNDVPQYTSQHEASTTTTTSSTNDDHLITANYATSPFLSTSNNSRDQHPHPIIENSENNSLELARIDLQTLLTRLGLQSIPMLTREHFGILDEDHLMDLVLIQQRLIRIQDQSIERLRDSSQCQIQQEQQSDENRQQPMDGLPTYEEQLLQ